MSLMLQELIGAILLLGLFLGVIAIAETLTRQGRLGPEPARKSIHLAGGLGCLLFPFVITSWITVMILAAVLAVVLFRGEQTGRLKSLGSVTRMSYGSLLFPFAILILFIVSQNRLWLYVSSLLVLVLADTAAALTGSRFGRICYETGPGQKKSLEGTLMFALVGFLSVYLTLLLLSDIPHLACILTAALMAALLAALEAVSIGGTDNILVPVSTWFLLLKIPTKPQLEILFQCLSFIGVALVVILGNRRSNTFHIRPLIIFILAAYSTWALGSAEWLIPVLVGFFSYNWICMPCASLPDDLTARRLLRPMYPMLGILFVANIRSHLDFWLGPFIVATSTATSLCIASRFRRDHSLCRLQGRRLLITHVLPVTASLLLCVPIQGSPALTALPVALVLCTTVTLLYMFARHTDLETFPWSYAITLHVTTAALLYAALQLIGIVPELTTLTWSEVFR